MEGKQTAAQLTVGFQFVKGRQLKVLIYAAPKIPRRFAPPKLIHLRPVYFFSDERLVFGENLQTPFPPLQRPTSKISSRSLESAPFQLHGT